MARVPIVFTTFFLFAAFYVAYTQPLRRATSSGGIPVRIIWEGNYQLVSVSEEGAVFSNGTDSEADTCFRFVTLSTRDRIELKSSKYEGVFIGIADGGTVKAAPKQELNASTFEFTRALSTHLRLADTDNCALSFTDDGIAKNACSSDVGSDPDRFTIYVDLVC